MRGRTKVIVSILLITIVGLGVWQLSSSPLIPPVSTKYSIQGPYSNRGRWIILETMSYGKMYLAISITNVTYPRTVFSTHYSTVLSEVNETLQAPYVRGFGLRVESITIQDNYDGSASSWSKDDNLTDAFQADSIFNFHTSTVHDMRFTISYQLYDLFVLGYVTDHSSTRPYNITQSVL